MLEILAVAASIFLAELGDKTQIATLMYASSRQLSPMATFLSASLALIVSTGLAVALGSFAARFLEAVPMKLIAGVVFIIIGIWYVVEHLRST